MDVFLSGMALGLVVSIPPGPNATLCMNLACGGMRRAIPLITSAALTDAVYSLLAASGILLALRGGSELFAYLAPCFTIGTAMLVWSPKWRSPKAATGVAMLNPATAAIWLSLCSVPAVRTLSLSEILMRTLPVALGTAAWFTLLAMAAAKLSYCVGPQRTSGVQRTLAGLLAVLGVFGLTSSIHP